MGSNSMEISIREGGSRENGRNNTITRINQVAPTQADAVDLNHRGPSANFARRLAAVLFFAHLVAAAILIIILRVRGFLARNPAFHADHWYTPLLTSAAASTLVALLWLLFVLHRPAKALKASLWLSPSLACAVAVLLLTDDGGYSLAFGVLALAIALVQSLYGCWITRRLHHAYEILSASVAAVPPNLMLAKYVALALLTAFVYFSFWTLGAGGVAANDDSRLAPLYVLLLLLSLAWTMQAVRYAVLVAVAQLAYTKFASRTEAAVEAAFDAATAKRVLGDVCYGSAVVPTVVAFRGMAQAMGLVVGDSDEFLFSCASCFMGVADRLVTSGNRWGFVYVGVHGKWLGNASAEVWDMFIKQGMGQLIDLDLTGAFCFLCGVAGGGVSALAAGCWSLAAHRGHVTDVTVYAFIIGYFTTRIAMAWPQACVAAYHVVFAENPQNDRLGSCIPERLRQLRSSRV
ncbi:hypothetical protein OPV22_003371 [Ensete ventricosum]|uniref:Choline transporter-like protein n=1 Tax=Ensete ventricosum TaxID=4639 RepID=A0AAV8S0D9_ENSVE|nr:hypothetical protein OPV22_003371 [Ensete ventricosum]